MECEYESSCINNGTKCYRCYNFSLYKLNNSIKKSSFKSNNVNSNTDKSWEDLENKVVDKLNKSISVQEAKRSRGSGNTWFEKGDVIDSILTFECKERIGKELKTGEKSMSIKKEWLEKAKDEAYSNNNIMSLVFRFKDDNSEYIIMEIDSIIDLINILKAYQLDNDIKTKELEILKNNLQTMQK